MKSLRAAPDIYEIARYVGIPAEQITRFVGTLKLCGYVIDKPLIAASAGEK